MKTYVVVLILMKHLDEALLMSSQNIHFCGQIRTRTVFSEENVCPPTSLNRHIVKIDCIYNKHKVTIYLYISLVKIHPLLNEIGRWQAIYLKS